MSKKHHFQTLSGADIKRATVRHYQEKNTMSAGRSFALWQTFSMGMMCGGFLLGFWHDFPVTMAVLGTLVMVVFMLLVGLKLTIYAMDSFKPFEFYKPKTYLDDDELPVYTVIVALYQEKNSFPILLKNLLALDYPRDKLQFLFMLEADDKETIHTVVSHILPHENINISVLTLPHSLPRTKPKTALIFINCVWRHRHLLNCLMMWWHYRHV
jgi:glycosyltransferase XagB